jgi:hypothetical protein
VEKRPGGSYQRGRPGATPSGLKSPAENLAIGGIVELRAAREENLRWGRTLPKPRKKSIATSVFLFMVSTDNFTREI